MLSIEGFEGEIEGKFGRKLKKGLKKAVRKVAPVAGLVANVIPGVGQVASAAILAGVAVDKQKRGKKRAKRAMQAESALASAQAEQFSTGQAPSNSPYARALELPDDVTSAGDDDDPINPRLPTIEPAAVPWYKRPPVLAAIGAGVLGVVMLRRK